VLGADFLDDPSVGHPLEPADLGEPHRVAPAARRGGGKDIALVAQVDVVAVERVTTRSLKTKLNAEMNSDAISSGASTWCAESPAAFIAITSLF
jgi:hypothetical protein